MSEICKTGTAGEEALARHLSALGRVVAPSDKKTFDFIVDGKYAEVKSSNGPYSRLGFIGLTDKQHEALAEGVDFTLSIVCNLKDPENVEIIEVSAACLRQERPKWNVPINGRAASWSESGITHECATVVVSSRQLRYSHRPKEPVGE